MQRDFPLNLSAALPIIDQLDFGVYVIDLDFNIVLWNRRAEQITGFKASDVVDKCTCEEILNHTDRTGRPLCGTPLCPMSKALCGDRLSGKPASLIMRRRDTKRLPVLADVAPLSDDDGTTIGCIQMFRDESEALNDLRLARRIQRSILPQILPQSDRVAFDVAFLPHDYVGGDFYDVFRLSGGRYGVIVADVTGHGVSAALHTMVLKLFERAAGAHAEQPARYLEALNTEIGELALPAGFATAVYGIVDATTGAFVYSIAGHSPPLHYHARTGGVTKLESGLGLPLGMFETGAHGDYREASSRLDAGDILLLYTDGIIEVEDDSHEMFGMDGLAGLVERRLSQDGELLLELLYQDVLDMTREATMPDDVVLLTMRYLGPDENRA
jgi:hypothetical protein